MGQNGEEATLETSGAWGRGRPSKNQRRRARLLSQPIIAPTGSSNQPGLGAIECSQGEQSLESLPVKTFELGQGYGRLYDKVTYAVVASFAELSLARLYLALPSSVSTCLHNATPCTLVQNTRTELTSVIHDRANRAQRQSPFYSAHSLARFFLAAEETGQKLRVYAVEKNPNAIVTLHDYATELDETCIRNAAHLMVANLAGSLAHVTYKGLNIASELEQVQLVTNDKLDLSCALIEQAATEKVLRRPYLFLPRRKLATHAKIWLNKCGLRGKADQSSIDTTTAILFSHNIVLTKPDNVEMVLVDMIQVLDWAFEAASQEMRGMCQEAAYQPGLYLTATQVLLKPIVS
ncbi:hypothetical protein TEA_016244 [Camellia sinensis var. sinensis]|uniref:CCR4-NOT transcription complex subunit 1 domain-containing protein n=1 Tax=Camellia sinensis var. sinensis TaxID=542762 RepID=A0A4S4ETA2_CAMSN|nr:hypothetical protein TEA_016244 [Camellia sinensis var. sinensis]